MSTSIIELGVLAEALSPKLTSTVYADLVEDAAGVAEFPLTEIQLKGFMEALPRTKRGTCSAKHRSMHKAPTSGKGLRTNIGDPMPHHIGNREGEVSQYTEANFPEAAADFIHRSHGQVGKK